MTNKSKLTLIVDGNWLLMSRLAVISGRYPDTNELNRELKLLMIRSINLVLRTFPVIDNIIFVADGGSWRNTEVTVPLFLQNDGIEYKGNREHSDDIDWDVIFAGYEDFLNVLKDNGVTVSKEKMIEGDDWCWWWSTYLNSQGTNVIVWSKDRDLTQLVNTDNNDKEFSCDIINNYKKIELLNLFTFCFSLIKPPPHSLLKYHHYLIL